MNRKPGMNAGQIIGTMNGLQVIRLDIAKHVFQLLSLTAVMEPPMFGVMEPRTGS